MKPVERNDMRVALYYLKRSPSALLLVSLISTGCACAAVFSVRECFKKPDLLWNRFSDRPAHEKVGEKEITKLITFTDLKKGEPQRDSLRADLGPYKY